MDCPFCNIDPQKTVVVNTSEHVKVIFSNPRLVECHLLVIPRRHVEKIAELSKEEQQQLFEKIVEYQEKILKFSSGCDIRQHYRPFLEQDKYKIDHLHIHLLPREWQDEIYTECLCYERGIYTDLDTGKVKELLKKFDS